VFEEGPLGLALVAKEDYHFLQVNRALCQMVGYSEAELLQLSFADITHPDDVLADLELAGRLFKREIPHFQREKRYARKNGEIIWIHLTGSVIHDDEGESLYALAMIEDITEQKHAEAALRESEERFRNMADTAPVMIWVSGPEKLCTFVNQEWLTFTGSTMDEALGNGWSMKVHPDDRARWYSDYSSAFDARRRFQAEYRLRRADGEYRWVLTTGNPRFEPGGAFAGYVGSCMDITDVKHAHQEDLAKQKLETVGTLAGSIAHDFNNLLGAVLVHSELALAEIASGSSPMEELEGIRIAATRGAEIVRQLMVYAGEEGDLLELVDVSEIARDMLELLKLSVSKHVSVEADLGKQLPAARAHPAQIRQVVMNLVHNASEAIGDREGLIRVTTAQVTGPESSATSERMTAVDYIQLEVSDHGTRHDARRAGQNFRPFLYDESHR
jgi:two-component system cell cycle sensor histidine kinase/response regulator CckA